MSTTERIYALLVEANPVPEDEWMGPVRSPVAPHLRAVDPRRAPVQSQSIPQIVDRTPPPPPRRWLPAAVAAAVIAAAVIGGAVLFSGEEADQPPAGEPTTTVDQGASPDREASAVAAVEAFYAALVAGDIESMVDSTDADAAERSMWEFNIVLTSAGEQTVESCQSVGVQQNFVLVHCAVRWDGPVAQAVGIDRLTAPWWVYDDGTLQWQTLVGGDFTKVHRTYRSYMQLFEPAAWQAACDVAAYPAGMVIDAGMALTAACAEATLSVSEEVAAWQEAGGFVSAASVLQGWFENAVAVHNSGDFEAFRSLFAARPRVFGSVLDSDVDWEAQRSFMAAGEQWMITGECEAIDSVSVTCPATLVNDFMGPAGIRFEVPALAMSFEGDGTVVSLGAQTWKVAGTPEDYFAAFDEWLAGAHPEVHAGLGPRVVELSGDWGLLPGADDMVTVLAYVDEFLAASDVYPLEG